MRHTPRKRFGQNFLVDEAVVAAILRHVAPRESDLMVEIGPGLGALTRPLLGKLAHLHVVEIDRDLAARLGRQHPAEKLTVHQADALHFDFAALGKNLRVVGNLPYNISTPLLFRLGEYCAAIRDIHAMLQKEVAARIMAQPSTPEYGRLSVMLQYRFEVEKLLDVPAGAFRPAPKVESSFIRMTPRAGMPCAAQDEALFADIVAAAFGQRRKTLRNTLAAHLTQEDFLRLGIDARLRAENLTPEQFVRISDHLAARRGGAG